MAKPVRLRQIATTDLEDASDYYRQEAGEQTAVEFIDAVERSIKRISRSPPMGSLHFAYELAIPDLRAWPLQRFPYVVFYVVVHDEIDVWRILHTRRDLPATIEPPTSWSAAPPGPGSRDIDRPDAAYRSAVVPNCAGPPTGGAE